MIISLNFYVSQKGLIEKKTEKETKGKNGVGRREEAASRKEEAKGQR